LRKAYAQENYINVIKLKKETAEVVTLGRMGRELDRVKFSKRSK
jgi:hypothetical protein